MGFFLHSMMSLGNLVDLMALRSFNFDIFRLSVGLRIDICVLNLKRDLLILR